MTSPPPAPAKGLSAEEEEKAKTLLQQLMTGDKKPAPAAPAADPPTITSDDEGVRHPAHPASAPHTAADAQQPGRPRRCYQGEGDEARYVVVITRPPRCMWCSRSVSPPRAVKKGSSGLFGGLKKLKSSIQVPPSSPITSHISELTG